MTDLSIYNPQLRQKQTFSPSDSKHVSIRSVQVDDVHEQHIKALRHNTVLHMMSNWFKALGVKVTITNNVSNKTDDIALISNYLDITAIPRETLGRHIIQVGDILVPRKPNDDEDLYCAKGYLKSYGDEVVRFFLLRSQYRTTIQFTKLQVEDARRSLDRFYRVLKTTPPSCAKLNYEQPHVRRFIEAMNDDFNMLRVVAVMNDLANLVTTSKSADLAAQLKHIGSYLNVLQSDPTAFLHRPVARAVTSDSKWSFMKQVDLSTLSLRKPVNS